MTKFRGTQRGVFLEQGRQNSNFLIAYAIHITISGYASKYDGKIKFDKVWGTKMGGFSNFSSIQARHMKLSEEVNIKER